MAVNRMLRFVTVPRDMPSKRGADERREEVVNAVAELLNLAT